MCFESPIATFRKGVAAMRAGYIFRLFGPWHCASNLSHAVPLLALFTLFNSHISSSIEPAQNRALVLPKPAIVAR